MKDIPQFTIADIQLGVGDNEFKKAFALYEKGTINCLKKDFSGYSAIVSGTHDYIVNVSSISYDRGNCNCYIGQKDHTFEIPREYICLITRSTRVVLRLVYSD